MRFWQANGAEGTLLVPPESLHHHEGASEPSAADDAVEFLGAGVCINPCIAQCFSSYLKVKLLRFTKTGSGQEQEAHHGGVFGTDYQAAALKMAESAKNRTQRRAWLRRAVMWCVQPSLSPRAP